MAIEEALVRRLLILVQQATELRRGGQYGTTRSEEHKAQCEGWLAAALHIVQLACPNPATAYWRRADAICSKEYGYTIPAAVGAMTELLTNLHQDIQAGLLASIADRARAETFDNFLDHARAYLKDGRCKEAGVIGGVVFEDTLRRICRKHEIADKDVQLDTLISSLVKADVLSDVKAKRARVAAHVRTKATHAQWDEFEADDVEATIDVTDVLIREELD